MNPNDPSLVASRQSDYRSSLMSKGGLKNFFDAFVKPQSSNSPLNLPSSRRGTIYKEAMGPGLKDIGGQSQESGNQPDQGNQKITKMYNSQSLLVTEQRLKKPIDYANEEDRQVRIDALVIMGDRNR